MILPSDQERLTRIEEKINAMNENMIDLKTSILEAAKTMSSLHISYVPRTEIEKQIAEITRRAEEQLKRVEKLELWQSWLRGIIAVMVAVGVPVLVELVRNWSVVVTHP